MKRFLLLFFSFLIALNIWAQERVITGKVTSSEDGSALPGVNVLVKGTTNGTVSDSDGSFRISISGSTATLSLSFIGFISQDVEVGARTTIDVIMAPDVKQLSEVVVVGYGTQIKQDLTGNIARVKGDELRNLPVPSFDQALQGKAAGVFVEAGTGKLGQSIKVRVRGASSVSAANDPLYVVDGVPITSSSQSTTNGATNPLVDINPNDIESIEVLKDASASAIYGARAANGVVLISTKRGKTGKTTFNVGYFTGFSKETNRMEFLNTAEFVELFTESNGGLTTSLTNRFNRYGAAPNGAPAASWVTPGAAGYVDTDWQDQVFRDDAGVNQIDISASGGSDKTKFFASLSRNDQKGILAGNNLERVSGRVNLDHQATEKFSMGINFSLSRTINDRLSDDNAFSTPMQIVALSPMTPVIDPRTGLTSGALDLNSGIPNGNFPIYYNPFLDVVYAQRQTQVFRNFGSVYGSYAIAKGLTFRTELGYDLLTQNEERYFGKETSRNTGAPNGFGSNAWTQVFNYTTNNILSYQSTVDDHNIEVIGGMSFQESNTKFNNVDAQQFPSNAYKKITSAASITAGTSTETAFAFLSYFARANYKFKNKYLLGLSGRADGSSRFGADNRYGFFPAASAGWIVSEESFLNDNSTIEFLKLRASYGLTGNAEIANFASYNLFAGDGGYAGVPGQRPSQIENPNLRWEQTTQVDIGIDFGFFNSRITGEIDYYVKNTNDLLLNVNLPGTAGVARTQTRNVGELENKGFEIVLNSENLVGAFKWNTSFNFSRNRNRIIDLQDQVIQGSFLNRAMEGEPIGIFFGPKYAGVDPNNGDALYVLVNTDGTQTTTSDYNEATQMKIGDPNPDFMLALTNSFSYKGIDLSFMFQGVFGNQVYNGGGKFMSANGDFFDNQTQDQLKRWRNPGDITDVPQARLFEGNGVGESSRYLSDAGYLRLRTATIGYNLPATVLSKLNLTKLRVYVSGQNLLTFTDYRGWDPEVNADTYESNINQGIDFYSAPQAKTISLGVNISF
jgi:TonB-linked SusC/RagA family outer membrane protein